ncbi:MAG: hypothetical protein KC668_01465 [Myxococcales bacterium]|nr:hypothetical protein [Myxococcales bacterium]
MSDIDWSSFDTPFGPRTGGVIPALLEKLDSPDARVRARALKDIHFRAVAVNGGYGRPFLDVALALVPILAARLDAPGELAPQLGQVLGVLGDIAAGNHRLHVARGLPLAGLTRTDIGPMRATQAAVAALAAPICERLSDADAGVRAGAAFALAWIPGEAAMSIPALVARLAMERHAATRASLLLALGYVGAPVDALLGAVGDKAPVGICAALGVMLANPQRMDDVLDAALAPLPKPVVAGLPFLDGALARVRTQILGGATTRRGDLAAHLALVERLPPEVRPEAESWTVAVAAAGAAAPPHLLDPADLSDEACAVLRQRAGLLRGGRAPGLYQAFGRAGLFSGIDGNERALGLDPQGPLDERVEGRPLWWWLYEVRAGRVAPSRFQALLAGRDALAVLEDAATSPYKLYEDPARPGVFQFDAFADLLGGMASALGVTSTLLDERLAKLREYATKVVPSHQPSFAPWP